MESSERQEVEKPPVWCPLKTLSSELLLQIVDICKSHKAVKPLSLVNKLFRALCIPVLFEAVTVGAQKEMLHVAIGELSVFTVVLQAIRTICIKTKTPDEHEHGGKSQQHRSNPCHKSLPAAMSRLLGAIPRLAEVKLSLCWGSEVILAALKDYVKENKISLPHVRSLDYWGEASTHFMLTDVFPNLENLCMRVYQSPQKTRGLDAIRSLKNLKALSLDNEFTGGGWHVSGIQRILWLVPGIKYLVLTGELKETRVSSLVDIFAQFASLQYLAIPSHQLVDGFPNFSDDDEMEEMEDLKDEHPLNEDEESNAVLYFTRCYTLKNVTFFRRPWFKREFVPARDSHGKVVGAKLIFDDFEEVDEGGPDCWHGELPALV